MIHVSLPLEEHSKGLTSARCVLAMPDSNVPGQPLAADSEIRNLEFPMSFSGS